LQLIGEIMEFFDFGDFEAEDQHKKDTPSKDNI
jgi:hypothetical protein